MYKQLVKDKVIRWLSSAFGPNGRQLLEKQAKDKLGASHSYIESRGNVHRLYLVFEGYKTNADQTQLIKV